MDLKNIEFEIRLKNFQQKIHEYKLALTPQKFEIYKILATSYEHPDAKEIYKQVKKKFPNISLSTIYKNLKKFIDLDLIQEIPVSGQKAHYDARLDVHSHVIDTKNGHVYDLNPSPDIAFPQKIHGKKIKSLQITYYI